MAADGGCERDVVHRMNEGYRAWGALKSVLNNRGNKAKRCRYEGVYTEKNTWYKLTHIGESRVYRVIIHK